MGWFIFVVIIIAMIVIILRMVIKTFNWIEVKATVVDKKSWGGGENPTFKYTVAYEIDGQIYLRSPTYYILTSGDHDVGETVDILLNPANRSQTALIEYNSHLYKLVAYVTGLFVFRGNKSKT